MTNDTDNRTPSSTGHTASQPDRAIALHRAVTAIAAVAAILGVSACGTTTEPAATTSSSAAANEQRTERRPLDECAQDSPDGPILRDDYGGRYANGELLVQVKPAGGDGECLRMVKSGNADPQVPPDSLLLTFSGAKAEGAQIDFLALDLAGALLPATIGPRPRVGPLNHPITAQVGVSVGGHYFAASQCALSMSKVNSQSIAGRFSCPAVAAADVNPLDPSDDVPTGDESETSVTPAAPGAPGGTPSAPIAAPSTPTPSTPAAPAPVELSGWFSISR